MKKMKTSKASGCVHFHVKDGKIRNILTHLSGYPEDCVIHLKPDSVMTIEELKKSHPNDIDELHKPSYCILGEAI